MVGFGLGGLLAISTPLILSFFTVSSSVKKQLKLLATLLPLLLLLGF